MPLAFSLRAPRTPPASSVDEGIFMPGQNGRALILIHGLTGTPGEMRFLAGYFNRVGFTVYCPRLANHGKSLRILTATRWQEFHETVRRSYAKARANHQQVHVAGISMGALLGLLLAEENPEGVAGVSCLSPTLFYDGWSTWKLQFLLPFVFKVGLKNFLYFKEEPPYGLKNPRLREMARKVFEDARLHGAWDVDRFGYPYFPFRLLHELRRLVKRLEERLPSVHCPCQIIQAREDDITSPRNAQFIYERVSSVRKEIVYLEDSYHLITADQEREKVARYMSDFICGGYPA